MREETNRPVGNPVYNGETKIHMSTDSRQIVPTPASLAQAKINPNGPTGLVPQKVDQQFEGIQQLKKPLNFPNQKQSDDYKDTYNPDKKPDPGAYA